MICPNCFSTNDVELIDNFYMGQSGDVKLVFYCWECELVYFKIFTEKEGISRDRLNEIMNEDNKEDSEK